MAETKTMSIQFEGIRVMGAASSLSIPVTNEVAADVLEMLFLYLDQCAALQDIMKFPFDQRQLPF
jgi:hypothetical protein